MARAPDPKAKEARKLYIKGMKLIDIAKKLDVPAGTVRRWKCTYKWDGERSDNNSERSVRTRGAPKGSKNAKGNKGGAAPKGNKNAEKYGFFAQHLPDDALSIFNDVDNISPIDLLWHQIKIAYTNIVRAQKFTANPIILDDKFFASQARAQSALNGMIKQYEEMVHKNWDMATEEQKARIAALMKQAEDKDNNDKSLTVTLEGEIEGWAE